MAPRAVRAIAGRDRPDVRVRAEQPSEAEPIRAEDAEHVEGQRHQRAVRGALIGEDHRRERPRYGNAFRDYLNELDLSLDTLAEAPVMVKAGDGEAPPPAPKPEK